MENPLRRARGIGAFVAAAAVMGLNVACAVTTYRLEPHTVAGPPAAARELHLVLGGVEVKPTLPDTEAVGVKKNGYGHEMAHVLADPNANEWFQHAVTDEFKNAGLIFAAGNYPRVAVVAEQLFSEVDMGFFAAGLVSIAAVRVYVRWPDGKVVTRRFVHYADKYGVGVFDSTFQKCADDSVHQTLQEAAREIRHLVESST